MDMKQKARVAILVPDKIDFKTKSIKRDRKGHFIIIKGNTHQEDITIINIYALNIGASKYIRKTLEDFKLKKMGKGLEQTLFQGGHKEDQETYEKMLSITSHQRDVN